MVKIILTTRREPPRRPEPDDAIRYSVNSQWIWKGDAQIRARPQARLLFLVLVGRAGEWVSRGELIHIFWGWRLDGGPEDVVACLQQVVLEARAVAALFGFAIEAGHGRGYTARRALVDAA